jgi:uncharacterized protein (TIGR03083 family)
MDYSAAFLDENRAFGEVVRGGDPSAAVTACPDWNLGQLFRHVGRGDRWAAQIIAERADHRLDPRTVDGGKPPPDPDDAISWLHAGAQLLNDAVEQAGVETPVWTFIGQRPAYWWIRRRLHETTVHRADAALAAGLDYTVTPELAADAVSEWLELVAAQAGHDGVSLPLPEGQTVHLHATDPGLGASGEWTINAADGRIVWAHDHGKGAVALRGEARDLLLAITRRIAVADSGIEIFGDTAVWQDWLRDTPF